ncbi:MAG: NimC/NimA family protein [Eggerthellaceae bacterium]|nr:NimC/NimA family protein [Eggerthellaceae bacterium]MDR2716416.1 NimC/NimA family protein [Coriobacteriaceae bacterium]
MDEVLAYLKENETYFVATVNGDRPGLRPFGTIMKYENRLYIQTGRVKDVYKQMVDCPRIVICASALDGSWLRLEATAIEDNHVEANAAMLAEYPELTPMYKADDGNCTVFYLKNAKATFYSFTQAPKTITF